MPTVVKLARLLVQGKAVDDLVEVEVPRTVQLYAPVVTADNVDTYLPTRRSSPDPLTPSRTAAHHARPAGAVTIPQRREHPDQHV